MGYNLRTAYCELSELEEGGVSTISAIFGSGTLEGQRAKGESIVDLKLGSLGDFGRGLANNSKDHRVSRMEQLLSASGSSKRARTPSNGGQVVSCLVDGCKSDLSKCRDYHRRHKVCEMHSKTPRVTIGGNEQRFCQQCSRFHSLEEFDEGKRSCRKRLEGHNRRRRKPQPETLPMNHGNFLSASPGGKFLPFSNQPIIPASSVVSTMWSGAIKPESSPTLFNNSSISGSYSHSYRSRQFPFLQGPESPLTGGSSTGGQMLHHQNHPNRTSGNVDSINTHTQKMFCNDLNQVINPDSALSLLSSSPAETPEMGSGHTFHPAVRTTITGPHYNSIGPFPGSLGPSLEGQPGGPVFMSSMMRSSNSFSSQDVFQSGTNGSGSSATASGGHQTISFSWE